MKECISCGFNDADYGCACPSSDKWYACPIENKKPENVKELEEYAEWLSRVEDKEMTREEAIKIIYQEIHDTKIQGEKYAFLKKSCDEKCEALDMAIKALEAADLDGYSSRLWKAAYERGKAEQTSVLGKIRTEIKEWYWQADKQALAKDPCVVDAMIDLFIRTIDKYMAESEVQG